jgi:hypothetical protein
MVIVGDADRKAGYGHGNGRTIPFDRLRASFRALLDV